jgi:hypothetical protein
VLLVALNRSRTLFKKIRILTFGKKEMKMKTTNQQKTQAESLKVQMFLNLRKDPVEILQEKARNLGLDDNGSVLDIARRIANSSSVPQVTAAPQAFALKSKDTPEAQEFIRKANARILPQDNGKVLRQKMKVRAFLFLDKNGVEYSSECPFVSLKNETALTILSKGWIYSLENQRALLVQMQKDITQFSCSLIRKKTANDGRFYLMLHVEPRK